MQSLYKKQILITAGILLASFFLLAVVMMVATYNHFVARAQSQLETTAESAAKLTKAYSLTGNLETDWNLQIAISLSAQISGTNIIICDKLGEVVLTSDFQYISDLIGKTVPDGAVAAIKQTGRFTSFGDFGGLFDETRYIHGSPILSDAGDTIGLVFASSSAEDVIGLFLRLIYTLLIVCVITLTTTLVVTTLTTRSQVKPLIDMAQIARNFGRGNYSVRAEGDYRKDEIGELTRAFNAMADSIERSEKLRQEFIANVSHELRTPMTTISGFVDGLLDGTVPEDMREACLKTVSEEVHRLSRLVVKMLELSRLQAKLASPDGALKKTEFDISEVLRITLLGMEQKINSKSLEVETNIGDEEVIVVGEKDGIVQVVYNLLGNAVKFADKGTRLTLSLQKSGGKAVVSFSNQGPTIPSEELDAIFERFHKTDPSRSADKEGLGLGLYIVKSIIKAHGEDILVTSKDGLTTVTITLALSPQEQGSKA